MPLCNSEGKAIASDVSRFTVACTTVDELSGATSRSASGDTGSLKVRMRRGGGAGMTAPSAGSLETRVACACAGPASTTGIAIATRNAAMTKTRIAGSTYFFGRSLTPGAGSL